ncbi:MAG: hypothetical protein J7605_12450 [Variovorax sp.]|nr:hypothetical protein [Variovorax sp.]
MQTSIRTTVVAWLVTRTVHAQQPPGRSRAEVQAEAVSAAQAQPGVAK